MCAGIYMHNVHLEKKKFVDLGILFYFVNKSNQARTWLHERRFFVWRINKRENRWCRIIEVGFFCTESVALFKVMNRWHNRIKIEHFILYNWIRGLPTWLMNNEKSDYTSFVCCTYTTNRDTTEEIIFEKGNFLPSPLYHICRWRKKYKNWPEKKNKIRTEKTVLVAWRAYDIIIIFLFCALLKIWL